MMEIWRDVVGYEGKYQVSNFGNIKSLNYNNTGKPQLMVPRLASFGYYQILLSKKQKCKLFTVHRLVAQAFIPNPDGLPCVNHRDENPKNNKVDNLEWCTVEYNNNYGTRNDRISKKMIGNNNGGRQVRCVETGEIFKSGSEAARRYNKKPQAITSSMYYNCKCAGYHWEYV